MQYFLIIFTLFLQVLPDLFTQLSKHLILSLPYLKKIKSKLCYPHTFGYGHQMELVKLPG